MSTSDRHTLPARLARGEEAAFAELYDACADRLHHYLAVRLGSRDAAADVVQATFLRAVRSRRRFRDVENPVAYMFQVARNEAARTSVPRPGLPLPPKEAFAAADRQAACDDMEVAAAALGRLPAEEREIVELKIYSGLTFREIATVTNRPQGTVATRYRRALQSLRGWLAKQLG